MLPTLGLMLLLLTTSSVQAASPKASDFDGDFDYFILTRPWGPSVCPQGGLSPNALCRVNTPHVAPPPAKWTIHGLWPAKNNGVFIDYCFKDGSVHNEAQVAKNLQAFTFTPGRPSDAVLKEQSSVWPSFLVRDEDLPALAANRAPPPNPARYNLDFWKHEWLAHGTCAFKSRAGLESDTTLQEKYFSLAKHLHARLASSNPKIPVTLNKDPKGQNGWIVMGKGYTSSQILRNFKDAYGVQVTFTCAARDRMHPDGFRLILEVKWCYDKKLTLRDCPSIGCVEDGDFKYGFQESTTEDGQVDAAGLVTETTVVAASSAAAAVLQPANKVEARTAALTAGFSCLASAILGAVGATKTPAKQAELQLKGNIAFDGINIWSLTLPPAVNASVLGKAVVSRLVSCTKRAGPRLVVKSTVARPAGMLLSATFSVDIKNRLVWLQSSQGNYMYLLDEASKMFNSLWGLTPKPSTTPESFSASMSMAVGSAGLQTVLVQVGTILTPAKLASRLGFTWPFPDSFLTISNSSVTFTGRKVSYADYAMENPRVSVQARVKIPDVNLNARAMIDVQSKQSLTLTLMESWTVPGVPNLEINPADTLPSSLTLSSAAGVQGFVSARFVDVPVQVLISIASKPAQARGAKKLTLAAEASNVNLGKLVPAVWPNTPSLIKAVLANTTFVRASIKYSGGAYSLSADAKLDVLGSLQTLAGCQLPAGVVSIDTLAFSIDRGTGSWSAVGKLVDIPIAARFTVANTKKRMGFRLTATNVSLVTTVKALWSSAPAVVTDTLQPLTFASLVSTNPADILYLSASTRGTAFRVGLDGQGLRLMAVSLPGTLTVGSIMSGLGVSNAATLGDILTLTATTLVYVPAVTDATGVVDVDGTQRSSGLSLNMILAVPALKVPASNVSVLIASGDGSVQQSTTFKWSSPVQPIPFVTLRGVQLALVRDGLIGTAVGSLVSVPVTVNVALASKAAQTSLPAVAVVAIARQVNMGAVLSSLWPNTPSLVTSILSPVSFAELRVRWDSNANSFGVSGNPDLTRVPELKTALDFLQLGPEAIVLRTTDKNTLDLGVAKSWPFSPGAPFVGDALVGFRLDLEQDTAGIAVQLQGAFAGVLFIDIFENPLVNIECQAGFKLSRFGSSLNVSASFSGAMSIKGFPFLKLTVLSGSLSLNPGPPLSVTAARLRVNGTLVTTRITSDMHYDAARGVFGMQTTVDNFSLQDTLGALGIDVNLGIANVAIRNARVAYAAVDINSDLQAGMHVRGQFSLFGLRAAVAFSMDSNNGVRLATSLDFSQLTDAFYSRCENYLKEIGIDLSKINVDLQEAFAIEHFIVEIVISRTQQLFKGSLHLVVLGTSLQADLNIDASRQDFFLDAVLGEVRKFVTGACTRDSYDRGAGRIPDGCTDGNELFSGLCYKKCSQNWKYGAYGRDAICYQNCPPGYHDDDLIGQRGLTCSAVQCDPGQQWDGLLTCTSPCQAGWSDVGVQCYENCPGGWDYVLLNCQRYDCDGWNENAGICYKPCDAGWYSDGAALCLSGCPDEYRWDPLSCWRDYTTHGKSCCETFLGCLTYCCGDCLPGYYNTGCFCARDADVVWRSTYATESRTKLQSYTRRSYDRTSSAIKSFSKQTEGRGVGTIPTGCTDPTYSSYEDGLCYAPCAAGYSSFATMCVRECPSGYTYCGSFCVPPGMPGGCAAFVGATYQSCRSRYLRRSLSAVNSSSIQPAGPASSRTIAAGEASPDALEVSQSLANNRTQPGCTSSVHCFCKGVKSGLLFASPFVQSRAVYIICHADQALVQDCGPAAVFNGTLGGCQLDTTAIAGVNACKSMRDGVYARKNTTGGYEVFKCKRGQEQPAERRTSQVGSAASAQSVSTGGHVAPQRAVKATYLDCNSMDCFCQGKPDGVYLDVLAPAFRNLEASLHYTAAADTLISARIIAAAYKHYVSCAGGVAHRESCPDGEMFHVPHQSCIRAVPASSGTFHDAPPGCFSAECACRGRVDGMYINPADSRGGLICSMQQAHPFTCPAGYSFRSGLGCTLLP